MKKLTGTGTGDYSRLLALKISADLDAALRDIEAETGETRSSICRDSILFGLQLARAKYLNESSERRRLLHGKEGV